jgi:pimeloyl-ACP methyl ester carboxylesterase
MTIAPSTPTTAYTKQTWLWQGHKIQYTVVGEGQPLMLLHGFGASIDHWRKNIPVFAAAGYRVYAIDLLGFGGSAKADVDYSMELWEELVVDFHREFIKVPTVWIGNSIGALLGLMLATKHPEITKGCVPINCAGGMNHRSDDLNIVLRAVMGVFTAVISSELLGGFLFDRIRQRSNIKKNLYQVYPRREAITDELVEILYLPSCDAGAQKVFANVVTSPAGPTTDELLPNLQHPLLVVWGDKDPWTPIKGAETFKQYASLGKEIEIVPIPDAGHCPHDEYPELVNPAVIDWLARKIDR